jgi:hypothetical protein
VREERRRIKILLQERKFFFSKRESALYMLEGTRNKNGDDTLIIKLAKIEKYMLEGQKCNGS